MIVSCCILLSVWMTYWWLKTVKWVQTEFCSCSTYSVDAVWWLLTFYVDCLGDGVIDHFSSHHQTKLWSADVHRHYRSWSIWLLTAPLMLLVLMSVSLCYLGCKSISNAHLVSVFSIISSLTCSIICKFMFYAVLW